MRRGTLLALALLLATSDAAHAQEADSDTVAPVVLPSVTVTVLRTPIELARVPYAVAINREREIQRARPGLALDEALRGIPGVQVDNRYNYALGERISIRGFGARAQFGVRGIRVLVDGIPATFPDGQTALSHIDPGFLGRAEVIRGPAAALYGNTAGGVIQLETERVPDAPLSQEVGVTAGADGLLKLHGTTGGRNGNTTYLLNLSRLEYGGYREFSSAENLRLNARLGYAGPRDDLRLTVSAVDYDARNPGSLSRELLREDRFQAYGVNQLQRTGEEGRQVQAGATWSHTAGAGDLELTAYAIAREVENPIPPTIIDLDRSVGGLRALFRAAPLLGPLSLQWIAGVDADLQRDDRRNFENLQGERGAITLDQEERVTNLAAFAQLTATPTLALTVLGAVRYDRFRFSADDRQIDATNPDDSGSRVMDALSPSLGVAYEFGDGLSLYANVATAFETPTTTELANRPDGAGGFNPSLEPQEADSYEVGARGTAGAWLAYQAAAYRTDIENALIPFQVPGIEGRDFFRNAGSAVHRGVELSATLAALPRTRVHGAYTWTDARFDRYAAGGESFDGNRVPGVAPHRLELIASYETPGGWFLTAENRYASELPVDDANDFHSPAYWVTDLRASVERLLLGRVALEPFVGVTNLFDEEYNTSVTVNAFGGRFYEPGPGRALYAGATLRLGT